MSISSFLRIPRLFSLSLSPVDVYDLVLIDVLEYVRGVHQDPDGADSGHDEEHVKLKPINHHCHELPVLADLERIRITIRRPSSTGI